MHDGLEGQGTNPGSSELGLGQKYREVTHVSECPSAVPKNRTELMKTVRNQIAAAWVQTTAPLSGFHLPSYHFLVC